MSVEVSARPNALANAIERARRHLLDLQNPAGWWKGELESNVTIEAEDLFLRRYLGILDRGTAERTARWIRSRRQPDGTWTNYHGGPPDLHTTTEAYVALRLAGDQPDDARMRETAAWIRERGGVEATRSFTRIWLSLNGWWSWHDLPAMPPEVMLLPAWWPLNIYDFACWARQTYVALTIIRSQQPVRPAPFPIDELHTHRTPPTDYSLRSWSGLFNQVDRVLRWYEKRPLRWLREAALNHAEAWIVRRQERDGSWGGIQPPWVNSILALTLRGYPLDHPVIARALEGLDSFTIDDGHMRRLEACQSPVWDTALAIIALTDAGTPDNDAAIVRAADWLLEQEVRTPGDWAVRRPGLQLGGWAFEFANDNYPDIDDTAEVGLALRRVRHPDSGRLDAALVRARGWIEGMQSRNGGWGAFDADNTNTLCREPSFRDFGEVIDPPSADVTGRALHFLAQESALGTETARRGLDWLRAEQESDGSWFGRWGANHIYGLSVVVPTLVAAGAPTSDPALRRAAAWLEAHQNADGGWGEDLRSYDDPAWIGRGASTASQTAWALMALLEADVDSPAIARGVKYLLRTQREDGTWDEELYTGTGFPGAFYIRYHLYRLVFPLMALGRYAKKVGRDEGDM